MAVTVVPLATTPPKIRSPELTCVTDAIAFLIVPRAALIFVTALTKEAFVDAKDAAVVLVMVAVAAVIAAVEV